MTDHTGAKLATLLDRTQWIRYRIWLPMLAGALAVLLWAWRTNSATLLGPIIAVDEDQQRTDTTLPAPRGGLHIQQSFYPRWNGLREVELIIARADQPESSEVGQLFIQLYDDQGGLVTAQTLATRTLTHNQVYALRFAPQAHSAGRRYLLQIGGSEENTVSVWGYSLDVNGRGELTLDSGPLAQTTPKTAAQELRFITRYQLTWRDVFFVLGSTLYWEGALLLLALLLVPLPGALLLQFGSQRGPRWDLAAWWGTACALGVAAWPLLWFGLTLIGGRWRAWSLWMIVIIGWISVVFLWLRAKGAWRGRSDEIENHDTVSASSLSRWLPSPSDWRWQHAVLIGLLLLALFVRLLAVRDLVFPPWVDASRHALIMAVMAARGQTPADYLPFMPVERFPYHFGFHTLAASLSLMTDWPLHRLLLFLGQWINGMLPLTVYATVWLITRRSNAGLISAFLVALPFFFPAYYTTWGRLTQLTAMFVMPVLLAFTWLLVRGGPHRRRGWWLISILAAGLFLIHFRVFLFYLPFAAIVWLITLGRNGRWLAAAAGLAALLVSMRVVQLVNLTEPGRVLSNGIPNYNAFPTSYVQAGWEQQFLALAAVAWLLTLVPALRGRRWTTLPMTLAGWVAVLVLLLSGERLGLPETSLVNLNSMYITLFLPLAILLGVTIERLSCWLSRRSGLLRLPGQALIGGALMASLLFGVRQQISILNPQTILARWQDLPALEWVQDNLPEDATLAVNSWQWLGNTWAGSDGGAWLTPYTARASTTPPVDHIYSRDLFAQVIAFNEAAAAVTDWSSAEAADWLRQQRVSHVFIGARGGFFDPATVARNPKMKMIYGRDGVFVFALEEQ